MGTEFGQFTGWLVGIASTLLAVAAVNPEHVQKLLPEEYKIPALLLLTTIIGGVLYRIVGLWITQLQSRITLIINGALYAFQLGAKSKVISEPPENMSREETVRRVKEEYEADFSYLLENEAPNIEGLAKVYRGLRDLENIGEEYSITIMMEMVCAYIGLRRKTADRVIREFRAPKEGEDIFESFKNVRKITNKTRKKMLTLRITAIMNICVFTVAALSFIGAMTYITWGLISA